MTPPELPSQDSHIGAFRPISAAHDEYDQPRTTPPSRPSPADATSSQQDGPESTSPANFRLSSSTSIASSNSDPTESGRRSDSPKPSGGGRFLRDPPNLNAPGSRASSQSPFRLAMPYISPGQLALSALQYLPVPTMVLNSLKTVVIANEAMGSLLGIISDKHLDVDPLRTMEGLRGQTLAQVGVDMLQDGHPVWMTWDTFLDTLTTEMGPRAARTDGEARPGSAGNATPTLQTSPSQNMPNGADKWKRQDAVVEVVITRKGERKPNVDSRPDFTNPDYQAFAKMIITIWEVEDRQTYFTLTFTSTDPSSSGAPASRKLVAKSGLLDAADRKSIHNSNQSSVASSRDSSSPSFHSPGVVTMSSSPFPPMGPPSAASHTSTPSLLQKLTLMKDALLDNTQMPIMAMWKDGSATFANKFARGIAVSEMESDPARGIATMMSWELWNEEFTRRLPPDEYPLSVLIRTETPFPSIRVGVHSAAGKSIIYDVLGEAIRDDTTGEFLAGVVTGRDVTVITKQITEIKEQDEERFRLICDTMPQLVWTATPSGLYDFLNSRWYEYTGFKPAQCLGKGLEIMLHPDDVTETLARWNKSLETGEPFRAEYRCPGVAGDWRWYLGQALAVRDKDSGDIVKWFGTCTDIHESTASKLSAHRLREQLRNVVAHAHVTIFTVDLQRRVTMLEGALIWNNRDIGNIYEDQRWWIGEDIYTVFNRLTKQLPDGEIPEWLRPIEDVIEGRTVEDLREHGLDERWFRTRFFPMHATRTHDETATGETCIEGAIGVVMDVTELRSREKALQEQSLAKRQAEANAKTAKDATRLKSQFLANMSHEIRTPITGVLGMAELLGGMELDDEQREYVDNIQSSAASLLTVINDILDFSKVESGRMEVEEVQFSLSVVVRDVGKMLQFAAERKNLSFQLEISDEIKNDMVVMGDPGRVRQIILNLLMNSIKFTTHGYVRFSVAKEKGSGDSVEVKFVVADTGIGMHEDVRKKLFKPFSQGDTSTARKHGGTGLGLTISKSLLDLMHGRITLESTLGTGTTVSFWIPFNKPQAGQKINLASAGAIPDRLQSEMSLSCNSSEYDQVAGNSPATENSQFGPSASLRRQSVRTPPNPEQELPQDQRAKMHILVVEDNHVNQKIATKTISRLGFQVSAVWNGKEALDYLNGTLQGTNVKPDIILMDVQMPVIDGYKCTHVLRHHAPYKTLVQDVPIVAMTASAIQGDREKCTKAGMDDYLSKPVTMSILEKMLIRWGSSQRKMAWHSDAHVSDCSETGESCDNADIPNLDIDYFEITKQNVDDYQNNMATPRPLAADGTREPWPYNYDSVSSGSDVHPQVRRPEIDRELSSRLQETKLIDAAGVPSPFRNNSYSEPRGGAKLTEENVNKLKNENQKPRY